MSKLFGASSVQRLFTLRIFDHNKSIYQIQPQIVPQISAGRGPIQTKEKKCMNA